MNLFGLVSLVLIAVLALGLYLKKIKPYQKIKTSTIVLYRKNSAYRWRVAKVEYTDAELVCRTWFKKLIVHRNEVEILDKYSADKTCNCHNRDIDTVVYMKCHCNTFDLAFDKGSYTAFQSWLESRPSTRLVRRSH